MQLTRFDRWLRESFVYETHVQTLRAAEAIPKGIRAAQLPDVPGTRFKYLYVARNTRTADAFIASLRDANLMFATTVVDRKGWFVRWIAPKSRSFTWRCVWLLLGTTAIGYLTKMLFGVFSEPAVQQMLSEAIRSLKN